MGDRAAAQRLQRGLAETEDGRRVRRRSRLHPRPDFCGRRMRGWATLRNLGQSAGRRVSGSVVAGTDRRMGRLDCDAARQSQGKRRRRWRPAAEKARFGFAKKAPEARGCHGVQDEAFWENREVQDRKLRIIGGGEHEGGGDTVVGRRTHGLLGSDGAPQTGVDLGSCAVGRAFDDSARTCWPVRSPPI